MADISPPQRDIPDKLYFRIGEVTAITDLAAYVLRFWESEFPDIKPKRTESGQRLYRKSDIETLLLIKHLLYDKKFTIQGARQYLRDRHRESKKSPANEKIREIQAELREIKSLLTD
ncbi:MAG: MerR family transcriptional regulator [Desulfobacterales bacterium]|nr:MerR family transcriptional regulator [Desulfobacterales bacterium]